MSIGIHQLKDSLKKFIKGNTKKLNCLIEETHHSNKLDEPSGTAIEIENLIKDEDKNNYINLAKTSLPLSSVPRRLTEEGGAGFGYGEK